MILYGFLALIAGSSAVAISRWRAGLWLVILLAAIQDPVRKMVPGAPSYLALSTVPVWFSLILGAVIARDLSWHRFRMLFPGPARLILLFGLVLIPPAFKSLTYSAGSWQFTLLGIYAYGSVLAMIMAGVVYPRRRGDIEKLLLWYVAVNAVMLIGSPLEPLGIGTASGLIGTSRLNTTWVTYRVHGAIVRLNAGLYRSPDVMGWHAATVVMCALLLALRVAGWRRVLFLALSAWGGVGVMLCARRKMLAAVAVFAVLLLGLLIRYGQVKRLGLLLLLMAAGLGVSSRFYQLAGADRTLEVFYGTIREDAFHRVQTHGFDTVLVTIGQAGVFGHGLGFAMQGGQNIRAERPRVWQESALDKAAAEIGLPGLAALFLLVGGFVLACHRALLGAGRGDGGLMAIGLGALLLANAASSVVSSQIYGDPFVGTFLAFLLGLCLSAVRLARAPAPPSSPPETPLPAMAVVPTGAGT